MEPLIVKNEIEYKPDARSVAIPRSVLKPDQPAKAIPRQTKRDYWPYDEVDAFLYRHIPLDDTATVCFESSNIANLRHWQHQIRHNQDNAPTSCASSFFKGETEDTAIKASLIDAVVNYNRINDIRYVNKYFEEINRHLPDGGLVAGCVETKDARKQRVLNKAPFILSYPFYGIDFIYKRILPKIPGLKRAYFSITKGHNRVITLPETLGRLYSCGFKIVETRQIGYLTWFVARKVDKPKYDMSPTYGPLVRLRRVGKDRQIIRVHKMRTMYPYSEYIQGYLYENNGAKGGGKIRNDYRVTTWGKLLRSLWLDELPMLYNLIRGDIKLVGVRPVSRQNFETYPEFLKEKRTRFKPGLIPPLYADLPDSQEAFYASENNYLDAYAKAPWRTDARYFYKAMYNIFIKRARSE